MNELETKAIAYIDMIADLIDETEKECDAIGDGYESDSVRLDAYGEIMGLIRSYKEE